MIKRIASIIKTINYLTKNLYIYLDEQKLFSIKIQIDQYNTIKEIYNKYSMQINNEIKKMNLETNNSMSKYIYKFIIINSKYKSIRIKLNSNDILYNKLFIDQNESKYNDLYYLPFNKDEQKIKRKLLNQSDKQTNKANKNNQDKLILFSSKESTILIDNIEKFSKNNNIFTQKHMIIDSNKLAFTCVTKKAIFERINDKFNNENLWTIIPIEQIKNIIKCNFEFIYKKFEENQILKKYLNLLFAIETKNNEILLFKTDSSIKRENWISKINFIMSRVKINKYFSYYDNLISELNRKEYKIKIKYIIKSKKILIYFYAEKFYGNFKFDKLDNKFFINK